MLCDLCRECKKQITKYRYILISQRSHTRDRLDMYLILFRAKSANTFSFHDYLRRQDHENKRINTILSSVNYFCEELLISRKKKKKHSLPSETILIVGSVSMSACQVRSNSFRWMRARVRQLNICMLA